MNRMDVALLSGLIKVLNRAMRNAHSLATRTCIVQMVRLAEAEISRKRSVDG